MALKDVRVLIVDDEIFFRTVLREIIGKIGFTIVGEAADGDQAVRQYVALRPHIVIMDIYMPEKNGIEATREMLALNKSANVLICSASDYDSDTQAALDVGAKAILKKPFVPKEIYETVKKVLGGK
ncbi:response regulator [Geomonas silvestris]|uniref:Response regulator n=1 Tax=Geomonas silvestris TaxID=2740184 RepID=A0A6V8MFD3_9BACT|nr:response regulator [Geomonas silvestris]GFO58389.1 response regulator [Geomonas silvestris]